MALDSAELLLISFVLVDVSISWEKFPQPQECGCACRAETDREKDNTTLRVGKLFDPSGRWLS